MLSPVSQWDKAAISESRIRSQKLYGSLADIHAWSLPKETGPLARQIGPHVCPPNFPLFSWPLRSVHDHPRGFTMVIVLLAAEYSVRNETRSSHNVASMGSTDTDMVDT